MTTNSDPRARDSWPRLTYYNVNNDEWRISYRGTEYAGIGTLPAFMFDAAHLVHLDSAHLAAMSQGAPPTINDR